MWRAPEWCNCGTDGTGTVQTRGTETRLDEVMAKIKPSSAKAKGRNAQKLIAAHIVEKFPELSEDDVVSRPMGSGGADLLMSPLAQKVFPVSVESKATKAVPAGNATEQAAYNAYDKTVPAVVWKRPRTGPDAGKLSVFMTLDDLIELIKIVRAQGV